MCHESEHEQGREWRIDLTLRVSEEVVEEVAVAWKPYSREAPDNTPRHLDRLLRLDWKLCRHFFASGEQ